MRWKATRLAARRHRCAAHRSWLRTSTASWASASPPRPCAGPYSLGSCTRTAGDCVGMLTLTHCFLSPFAAPACSRFIFTYGMLIYRLLGEDAEASFSRSFGISYGLSAAQEWKDLAIEVGRSVLILVIMEGLFLTSNASWLEARRACALHPCAHAGCAC